MRRIDRFVGASAAVLAALAVGYSGEAQAALANCPAAHFADGTSKVQHGGPSTDSAASACQYITPADQSNVASVANINAAAFFGTNTWSSAGILQVDPPNDQSGSFTIAGVNFALFDYAVVFKSGAGTNLIAFLLNEETASIDWTSPFTEPPFNFPGNGPKDVSHYTVVKRTGTINPPTTQIPEPAALALLGAGLLGLGLVRRRKS